MTLKGHTKRAIIGGFISLFLIALGTLLLGKLSGYEAKILIRSSISGLNTLCNTVALAAATILALILTLLGLSSDSKSKLKAEHYEHVLRIARLVTIVFVAAVISFLLFNLPITESETVGYEWYNLIYYTSLAISSILSASLIVVVLMLYSTVSSIIKIIGLGVTDHPWYLEDEHEEEEE